MPTHPIQVTDWLQLIRAEFEEPFGLQLTAEEAVERWSPLDRIRIVAILDILIHSGYLWRSPDGVYCRRPDDDSAGPWPGLAIKDAGHTARLLH